jgi:hypothetical protein
MIDVPKTRAALERVAVSIIDDREDQHPNCTEAHSCELCAPVIADAALLRALSAALGQAQERVALRRSNGTIIWETLSDPAWGARRRADGLDVFDYLVIPADATAEEVTK